MTTRAVSFFVAAEYDKPYIINNPTTLFPYFNFSPDESLPYTYVVPEYTPSSVVELLHTYPHLNDEDEYSYESKYWDAIETMFYLTALGGFGLIVFQWIFFCFESCCKCCQRFVACRSWIMRSILVFAFMWLMAGTGLSYWARNDFQGGAEKVYILSLELRDKFVNLELAAYAMNTAARDAHALLVAQPAECEVWPNRNATGNETGAAAAAAAAAATRQRHRALLSATTRPFEGFGEGTAVSAAIKTKMAELSKRRWLARAAAGRKLSRKLDTYSTFVGYATEYDLRYESNIDLDLAKVTAYTALPTYSAPFDEAEALYLNGAYSSPYAVVAVTVTGLTNAFAAGAEVTAIGDGRVLGTLLNDAGIGDTNIEVRAINLWQTHHNLYVISELKMLF